MPRYMVTATWEGEAVREVEAPSQDEAEERAYEDGEWCGFTVVGGQVEFSVERVEWSGP